MSTQVIKQLISESNIDPNDIEDLVLGCAFPEGEQGMNLARLVVYLAQLPAELIPCSFLRKWV